MRCTIARAGLVDVSPPAKSSLGTRAATPAYLIAEAGAPACAAFSPREFDDHRLTTIRLFMDRRTAGALLRPDVRMAKGRSRGRAAGAFPRNLRRPPFLYAASRSRHPLRRFFLDGNPDHHQPHRVFLHARACPPVQPCAGHLLRRPSRTSGPGHQRDARLRPSPRLPALRLPPALRLKLLRPLRGENLETRNQKPGTRDQKPETRGAGTAVK